MLSTVPLDGATGVAKTVAPISATFDEPIDCTTVTSTSPVLARESDGAVVPGTVICANATVGISPPFPARDAHHLRAALDHGGEGLGGERARRRLSLALHDRWDRVHAALAGADSVSDATHVSLGQIVEAYFSEPIDCATVKTDPTTDPAGPTFYLTRPPDVVVPATTVCVEALARLVPAQPLLPDTTYTVGLSRRITDLVGNAFAGTGWQFTTGTGTPYGSLSVAPEAGYTTPPAAVSSFVPSVGPVLRLNQACGLPSTGGQGSCTQVFWAESVTGSGGWVKWLHAWFEPITGEVSRFEYSYEPVSDFAWGWWRLPSVVSITQVVVGRVAGQLKFTDLVLAPATRPVGTNPPPVHLNGVLLYPP